MFSKSTQYALKAALYLAHRENPGEPVGTGELAKAINAPPQFLAKTLQKLVHANIISSVKGSNGGVFLSEENLHIKLVDILNEMSGQTGINTCLLGTSNCDPEHPCILHKDFVKVREGLNEFFQSHVLADFQALGEAEFQKRYNWIGQNGKIDH
jgi:Rrf2 family protein